MNKLVITDGISSFQLSIEQIKYIISHQKEAYDQTIKMFKLSFDKTASEYREENKINMKLLLNEKEVNIKRTDFYIVSSNFSINEDMKLTTKSLTLRYFEALLKEADYFDTINTINILFESLSDELNTDNFIHTIFAQMTVKQLIKLMTPTYFDDFQKDEYDLTSEEIILMQIRLLQYITHHNSTKDNIFILVDAEKLSKLMIEELEKCQNCFILVFTKYYNELMQFEDIAILEDTMLDLADEDDLYYQLIEHSYQYYTVEEVKLLIQNYIKKKYKTHKIDLINDIIHFSKQE